MLIDRPGSVSESSTSTRCPRRDSRRASVPVITDLPAPPLPTTATRIPAAVVVLTPTPPSGAARPRALARLQRDELGVAAEEHAEDLVGGDERLGGLVQDLHAGPRE